MPIVALGLGEDDHGIVGIQTGVDMI